MVSPVGWAATRILASQGRERRGESSRLANGDLSISTSRLLHPQEKRTGLASSTHFLLKLCPVKSRPDQGADWCLHHLLSWHVDILAFDLVFLGRQSFGCTGADCLADIQQRRHHQSDNRC